LHGQQLARAARVHLERFCLILDIFEHLHLDIISSL
jgi:hypothetical protein